MDAYFYLVASLLPLMFGPLIARFVAQWPVLRTTLDTLVAVAVGWIILFHILPHAYEGAGAMILLAVGIGFALPVGLERWQRRSLREVRAGLIILAFLGLGFHSVLDGVALFGPQAERQRAALHAEELHAEEVVSGHNHAASHAASPTLLALAVILHRLPVALAIWCFVCPNAGRITAIGLLIAIGLATVLGFLIADEIWLALSSPDIALLQALIGGMLLHVVVGHQGRKLITWRWAPRPDRVL
jgi:uncharacterized MnhB-related membrane protein